ncbi:MAG: hypothetical protein ACYDC0_13620 [Acidimicrobiales bacterium]
MASRERLCVSCWIAATTAGHFGQLGIDMLAASGLADLASMHQALFDDPRSGRWASFAPLLLDSADSSARRFVATPAAALVALVRRVAQRLDAPDDLPIILACGLLTGNAKTGNGHSRTAANGCERLRTAANGCERLRTARPRAGVELLGEAPVAGAARLAQRLADATGS